MSLVFDNGVFKVISFFLSQLYKVVVFVNVLITFQLVNYYKEDQKESLGGGDGMNGFALCVNQRSVFLVWPNMPISYKSLSCDLQSKSQRLKTQLTLC